MGRTSGAKAQLIESAVELIYARSYTAVSIEDLCERAGVRRGSFHYFFRTKRELALAAIDEQWRRAVQEVLDPAFASDVPALKRIERYVGLVYEFQRSVKETTGRMQGCHFGNLACELSSQDDVVRRKLDEVFQRAAGYIAKAAAAAVDEGALPPRTDPDATAQAILAYIEGLLLVGKAANNPEIVRDLGGVAVRLAVPERQ